MLTVPSPIVTQIRANIAKLLPDFGRHFDLAVHGCGDNRLSAFLVMSVFVASAESFSWELRGRPLVRKHGLPRKRRVLRPATAVVL